MTASERNKREDYDRRAVESWNSAVEFLAVDEERLDRALSWHKLKGVERKCICGVVECAVAKLAVEANAMRATVLRANQEVRLK